MGRRGRESKAGEVDRKTGIGGYVAKSDIKLS